MKGLCALRPIISLCAVSSMEVGLVDTGPAGWRILDSDTVMWQYYSLRKKICAGVITARGLGTWGCASIIMKYELHLDFLIVLNEMSVGMSIYLCVCLPVGFGKKCFCPIIDIQACSVKWRSSHWWLKSLIQDFKNCECSKIMDQRLA